MEYESTNPSSVSKNPKQPILENLITNFSRERFDYVFLEVNKRSFVFSEPPSMKSICADSKVR